MKRLRDGAPAGEAVQPPFQARSQGIPRPVPPPASTQVLMDVLRHTNLAEMKDAAIVDWVGDVDRWLFHDYASSSEMRLLVVGVLCTIPWWRYTAEKALRSRRVIKLVSNLERVCVALVMHSPLSAERVLEVVLRPFTAPMLASPLERILLASSGGVTLSQAPFVPKELASRVLNTIAVRWPEIVSDLIRRCLDTQYPPRRWPYVAHHLAYVEMLLQLALESHVPNRAAPQRGGHHGASDSETTVTSETGGLSSHEDFSDTSSVARRAGTSGQALNHVIAATLQGPNNRLLGYREELIRLILRKLLEMENNVESSSGEGEDPMCGVIRATCETVYNRLADDLRRQQDAGSCGNAEWWKEIVQFHTRDVMQLKKIPVGVQFLAPALARLGANGEAADLLHRTISLATKKGGSKAPPVISLRAGRASASSAFVGMGPPAPAGAPLTVESRCLVAGHIAPMLEFLLPVLDDDVKEGVQRRLFKWLKEATVTEAPPPARGDTSRSPLVESVFAQCVGVCAVLGVMIDKASDIPPELLEGLMATFRSKTVSDGPPATSLPSPAGSPRLAAAPAALGRLYRGCPWALRTLDSAAGRLFSDMLE
jgi:hypothetical protein